MSSPYRASDRSSSSPRSTPSRTLANGVHRTNGYRQSLRNGTRDSPSRQLMEDFGRMLINEDRAFRNSITEQDATQCKLHLEALDRALAKHEEVRESAERARERVELEIERERRRREDEEKREVEKARRQLEEQKREQQRKQLEEQQAREEEQRKQAAWKREQEDVKRRVEFQRQQQEEEKARKDKQDREIADQKARQEAEAKEKAQQAEKERQQQAAVPLPQTNGVGTARSTPAAPPVSAGSSAQVAVQLPQGLVSSMDERETIHKQYLELHKRLKDMRKHVLEDAKRVPGLKDQLSEWRRTIQKCCGQLSKASTDEAKTTNRRAMAQIVAQLDAAAQVAEPSIDITQYLVQNQQPPGANPHGPACLLFLLNHLSKNIIRQFISESAVDAKSADAIGVLAVTMFARPQYLFNGQSLIDLLWAKYHKHCPVLFGISGSEKTSAGRERLGWHKEGEEGDKTWVREQEHQDRMAGLGAGFVAITLRDFSKSKNSNPAPNRIYWEAFARIVNTPKQEVQPTHFIVLKAIITNYVPRIISTFGGAGIAALRQALIYFPNEKGPVDEKGRKVPIVTAVQAMPVVLQRDLGLTL